MDEDITPYVNAFENFKFKIGDLVELIAKQSISPPPVGISGGFALVPAHIEQRYMVLERYLMQSPGGISKRYVIGGEGGEYYVHEIEIALVH